MSLLSSDLLAMIRGGVSVIVAARDAALRPSVMRAVGSLVSDDGRTITVFLARPQSRQLLQDLEAGSPIAVVFSQPSTHRSVQLKASRVALRPAQPAEELLLARYREAMERELANIVPDPAFTRAMLAARADQLVAVTFAPEQAFEQTPGPRAGLPMGTGP
ncbi:hypothetical protein [Ramlibacter sp.]|uniref:hypothetical protein n=1 Tax=Ramlibacter sp. TaxID=1917967 RepID=UPI003D0977E0